MAKAAVTSRRAALKWNILAGFLCLSSCTQGTSNPSAPSRGDDTVKVQERGLGTVPRRSLSPSTSVLGDKHLNKVIWYLVLFFSAYIFLVSEQVIGLDFYPASLLLTVVIAVQSLSRVQLCDPMDYSTTGFPVLHHLLELAQTHVPWSVMLSNHLVLCHPLLLLSSIFPSIRVFSNESAVCIRWPKYWSFNFTISPSNDHSGLISFRMDWFVVNNIPEIIQRQGLNALSLF